MAMTVAHNSSSALALNELNKNNSRLAKDLKRVSSGVRITGAADGTSEYAISEKMRVMVRALNQDIDNSKKGIDLVKVAEGGIQNIIDELRDMKAMALNSANGHNTNIDRAIIQKEFASRMEEINDIASTTNYNGRILLDGRWYGDRSRIVAVTVEDPGGNSGASGGTSGGSGGTEGTGSTGGSEGSGTGTGGTGGTGGASGTTSGLPTRPTSTDPIIIRSGNYTISTDGVYKLGTNYHGTVTITAKNVELQQTDSIVTDAYINCTSDHQNLWLNGIKIENEISGGKTPVDKSIIKFTGTGNTLNLSGNNYLRNGSAQTKATVNVGKGLVINDADGTGYLDINHDMLNERTHEIINFRSSGAGIGSDAGETSTGYIVINSGYLRFLMSMGSSCTTNGGGPYGASIGSGANGSVGMIAVNGGTIEAAGRLGAAIGSGYSGTVNGNIIIRGGTVYARSGAISYGTKIYEHSVKPRSKI